MREKRCFLAATLLSMSLLASAQAVYYSYDAAGNRVRREIVVNQQQAPRQQAPSTYYTDELADGYRVKIHTSPSSSLIRVEVISAGGGNAGTVTAFNLAGMKVQKSDIENGNALVDLGDSPSGTYILHIDLGGKTTNWKIIKK